MNIINLKNGQLIEQNKNDLSADIGEYNLLFYGVPILFENRPFSIKFVIEKFENSLSDILPNICAGGYYILKKNGRVVEIASDYYAHSRIYFTQIDDQLFISDDWRELPHKSMDFNPFQVLYFLNWDSCFNGETYFEDLKYFSPTYVYHLREDGIHRSFVTFPEFNTNSLFDSLVDSMKALNDIYGKMLGVMLSGGIDSSLIALAAKRGCKDIQYLCAHIDDIEMFDSNQDEIGAFEFAKLEDLPFESVDVSIKDFLQGWSGELTKYVAFSYKDGRLWQGIARKAKEKGYQLLVNGQNADALYNYSFTSMSENDLFMRRAAIDKVLENVFVNGNDDEAKTLWNKWNNVPFTREGFLAWLIIKGNGYMGCNGLVVDEACTQMGKHLYSESLHVKMNELITLFEERKLVSPRHLLIEGKLVGYVDGEDTRCICGACDVAGIKSLQIYTTPYVLDSLIHITLDEDDVTQPKRKSVDNCKKSDAFMAAQIAKNNVSKEGTLKAGQVWEIVYKILDEYYNFGEMQKIALGVLDKYLLFEEEKLLNLCRNDIGVKMRLSWIGLIYSIYVNSLCK